MNNQTNLNLLFVKEPSLIDLNNYKWNLVKQTFEKLIESLTTMNDNDFIKNYEYTYICFGYYINFLAINENIGRNVDLENNGIEKLFINFKYDENIFNRLCVIALSNNENKQKSLKIIKLINPFVFQQLNNNTEKPNIPDLIHIIKRYDDLLLDEISYKKIRNLVIYRNLYSHKNNYHNFYLETYGIPSNDYFKTIQMLSIMNIIPSEIKNNQKKCLISINDIITVIINNFNSKTKQMTVSYNEKNNTIIVIGNNLKPTSLIKLQNNQHKNSIDIQLQQLDFINTFNNQTISTKNLIVIQHQNPTNLYIILKIVHLITISIKICKANITDLYDSINILPIENYYYDSFVNFFTLIKPFVNRDFLVNNFIIELSKSLFVNAHFDYYFYYDTKLIEIIKKNIDKKQEIFSNFCNHLNEKLKLKKIMYNYPPFKNCDTGIDDIENYCFDVPNYFKFYDFTNALYDTYKINKNTDLVAVVNSLIPKPQMKNNNNSNNNINSNNSNNNININNGNSNNCNKNNIIKNNQINKLNATQQNITNFTLKTNGYCENYEKTSDMYILNTDKV